MSFSKGFFWGGALAANQCEGAYQEKDSFYWYKKVIESNGENLN
jgi:Beta-glucosidase/6-phospho-beta-glucosidase/beta-galactosidase